MTFTCCIFVWQQIVHVHLVHSPVSQTANSGAIRAYPSHWFAMVFVTVLLVRMSNNRVCRRSAMIPCSSVTMEFVYYVSGSATMTMTAETCPMNQPIVVCISSSFLTCVDVPLNNYSINLDMSIIFNFYLWHIWHIWLAPWFIIFAGVLQRDWHSGSWTRVYWRQRQMYSNH